MGRTLTQLLLLSVLLLASAVDAQDSRPGASLTPELLQSRIRVVESSTDVDQDTRDRLIQLYRQAVASLELARANEQVTLEFREADERLPGEIDAIRASLERRRATDPARDIGISAATPPADLDRLLQEELARRSAVETSLATMDARLETESVRPEQARERLSGARSEIETITGQATQRDPEESPLLSEASRFATEARLQALQAEVSMLEQELRTHDTRVGWLRAKRDEAMLELAHVSARVEALQATINEQRREELEQAGAQAQAMLEREAPRKPVLEGLAVANLALVARLQRQAEELQALSEEERAVRAQLDQLTEAFRGTRRRLQLASLDAPSGLAIRVQRQRLPGVRAYARKRREAHRAINSVTLHRLEAEEERRQMTDLDAYLASRIAEAEADTLDSTVLAELQALAETRRSLLDRALANDLNQQRRLYNLDDTLRQLRERTAAYDEFLAERLLWTRSRPAIGGQDLAALPREITAYLAPRSWRDAIRTAVERLLREPSLLLAALIALGLWWRRHRIRAALAASSQNVGQVERDRMTSTFAALAYTLLLALPLPLLLATFGRAMALSPDATSFSGGLAFGLTRTAIFLLLLSAARFLCEPDGMAERHFDQDHADLAPVRRYLRGLVIFAMPIYFVVMSVIAMKPTTAGGTLGLLSFVAFMAVPAWLTHGIVRSEAGRPRGRWRSLYSWLTLGIPTVVSVLALTGFTHAAAELVRRIILSAVILTLAWLVHALVRRWLLMTRRRLLHESRMADARASVTAPLERQRPPRPAEEADGAARASEGDIGGPEVDVYALDSDSRRLLNATMALLTALGLAGIWREVIPALGILERFRLWSAIQVVDGVESQIPVTLEDLVVAIVIGIGGAITAKNLPSLLSIVLLKQGQSSGGRYAVETLTRYAIVALTVLLVLGTLGATWSQMGWAAAALGLGIGFGVQEIVANFICGLILLFERPVRVGDVVSIGDISGTVTKIRIRATTLRDWDEKELVVPNKELITGRLLNWTLSDAVMRVLLPVGVAYGSNVDRALSLMLEAAHENERVLDEPHPSVNFEQFGDSSLNLTLRAYIGSLPDRLPTITALHRAIDQKFREAGIVIAFPQRDIHIQSADGESIPASEDDPAKGQGKDQD